NVVEGSRFGGQVGGPNRDEFGRGTVTPEVQQAVDGFAPLHIGNTGPHPLHRPRDLKARHDRSAVLAVRIGPRGVPGELGRSDGGRVNPDEGLPRPDARLGTVFVDQRLGSASRMTSNGFHDSAPLPSPTSINQPRMPPTVSPFPQFRMGPILHVVTLDADANLSTRLLMTSLQGIVNREQVELYFDVPKVAGNTSRTLSFLSSRYNLSSASMTLVGAIDAYANRPTGIVVFDSTRPESVDIATMIAAQKNGILVGSDL